MREPDVNVTLVGGYQPQSDLPTITEDEYQRWLSGLSAPVANIVGSGVDFLEPRPPPPPPPEGEHRCSSCGRRIIDGKWRCSCRLEYMLMMAFSLGAIVAVVVWALCK